MRVVLVLCSMCMSSLSLYNGVKRRGGDESKPGAITVKYY